MNERISELCKVDLALEAQALNNTNVTGDYFPLKDYRRALAVLNGGAMAATKTSKLELFEATDGDGTSAALISGASATITANTLVTEATITLATVLVTEAVVINGLTFTAHATVTTEADREFSISGNDTADAAELVVCINDATYGVPGVTATSAAGVVTLVADPVGEVAITTSTGDATFTLATVSAQAYVELGELALSSGCSHIAAKVTTTANSTVGVVLLRDGKDAPATQYCGASATV